MAAKAGKKALGRGKAGPPGKGKGKAGSPDKDKPGSKAKPYRTMAEFWPFYLQEHSKRGTRALHLAGTAVALGCLVAGVVLLNAWFLLVGLVAGYAFAWVAHFFVEHNRPATFTYPFKSFAGDWMMFGYFVTGRLGKQLRQHGVGPKG